MDFARNDYSEFKTIAFGKQGQRWKEIWEKRPMIFNERRLARFDISNKVYALL